MSEGGRTFDDVLDEVLDRDPRYAREAYVFVQMALDWFRRHRSPERATAHITGPELLLGVRGLALDQYGPLARAVLNHWGLHRGEDVGEIVYILIDAGVMSRSDSDRKEDFTGVMEFDASLDREHRW